MIKFVNMIYAVIMYIGIVYRIINPTKGIEEFYYFDIVKEILYRSLYIYAIMYNMYSGI